MRDIVDVLSAETPIGWALRLPLRLLPKGKSVPIIGTAAGGRRWILGSGPHSCWLGLNERAKRKVFSNVVRPGDVVFDVGANVGSYTILASVLVGAKGYVVAFEPAPLNVTYLREHVRLNNLTNVQVVESAIARESGTVRFYLDPDRVKGRIMEHGTSTVKAMSIDGAVSLLMRKPNCIKIDVEGAEVDVLRGAEETLRTIRPALFIATHGSVQDAECRQLLRDAGYRVQQLEIGELFATPCLGGA